MEIIKIKSVATTVIIRAFKNGKVLILPTDTVYGLVCDATNKKAVSRIFKIKKRSKNKSVPIFVKNLRMARKLTKIDKNQEKFLKNIWPGAVTLVLKRKEQKIKLYGVKKKTIALRIPDYKLISTLFDRFNRPLVGTSANISNWPASGNIKKVVAQFNNKKYQPDLIIDAGNLPRNKPSKVLDLTNLSPKILRN